MSLIRPLGLRRMAKAIASSYGDKGALIVTLGEEGYRFGVEGLTPEEVEKAACLLIHYNFCFDEEATNSCPTSLD